MHVLILPFLLGSCILSRPHQYHHLPFRQWMFICDGFQAVGSDTYTCKHSWSGTHSWYTLTLTAWRSFSHGASATCIIPHIVFHHKPNTVHIFSKKLLKPYSSWCDLTAHKFLGLQHYSNSINEHSESFWRRRRKLLEVKWYPHRSNYIGKVSEIWLLKLVLVAPWSGKINK